MTRAEINAFFPYVGPAGVPHFGGLNYAVPTLAWLQGPFWEFFRARYWSTNSDKWKHGWVCRDFARAYACAVQECWGDTPEAKATGMDIVSVGEMWFRPKPYDLTADGHALCPAITDVGLVFPDPQNNQLWQMSPEQFSSRYFLRF